MWKSEFDREESFVTRQTSIYWFLFQVRRDSLKVVELVRWFDLICDAAVDHLKRDCEHYPTCSYLQEELSNSFGKIKVKLHHCSAGVPMIQVHPHKLLTNLFGSLWVLNSSTPCFLAYQLISVRFHGNLFSLQIQHTSLFTFISTIWVLHLSSIRLMAMNIIFILLQKGGGLKQRIEKED